MIFQDPSRPRRVLAALRELVSDPAVERLRIAVAYANPAGVAALERLLLRAERAIEVEIVVTLDMGITREAALQALHDGTAICKVIDTGAGPGTFHAKAFVADRGDEACRAIVGSANLTYPALTTNHEAIWVGEPDSASLAAWEEWWADLWSVAADLTPAVIEAYEERRPPAGRTERIADEDTDGDAPASSTGPSPFTPQGPDPAAAGWLAIDWGGTGEYKVQLEIPREPAEFFSPVSTDKRPITVTVDGVDYTDNQLVYYSHNGMARINLDADLPFLAAGPPVGDCLLFRRLGSDHYEARLLDPAERDERLVESDILGRTLQTRRHDGTLRHFGWL